MLLIALGTTTPSPDGSPSLRPGLNEDQITPGTLGFLATAFVVLLTILLIMDMVRRLRKVRYQGQLRDEQEAREAGEALDGKSAGDAETR